MPPLAPPPIDKLLTHFIQTLSLHPRPTWLSTATTTLLTSPRAPPTTPALHATLKFRLLASDITASLQPHANLCFPSSILEEHNKTLVGPVAVQVLEVEDVGISKGEQLEALEMKARGEMMRGREVIRVVPEEQGVGVVMGGTGRKKSGPCKLLLEDAAGRRVFGVEMKEVEGVAVGMSIGAKLVLRNITIARGILLLTPTNTTVLGGKIDALHQHYLANQIQNLKASIEQVKAAAA